jgi:large subunit ribosomal protein LP0
VIHDFLIKNEGHPIANLLPVIVGNVGLIFTNADLGKIRDLLVANKVPAPARVGSLAPVPVEVPPGPTGCDPGQTSWFQALNIQTKINKGQIEIVSKVVVIKAGDKVNESQAALLQKLNIRPFTYGLRIDYIFSGGQINDPSILDITDDVLVAGFSSGVATFAALSLGLGLPNKATLVHSINDAYKALLAVALDTDAKFPRAKAFEDFLKNPGAFAAAPAAGAAAAAPAAAKEEKKVEKEEEKEPEMGGAGGLFGDDEW